MDCQRARKCGSCFQRLQWSICMTDTDVLSFPWVQATPGGLSGAWTAEAFLQDWKERPERVHIVAPHAHHHARPQLQHALPARSPKVSLALGLTRYAAVNALTPSGAPPECPSPCFTMH